jgi:hypothetical protein
MYVSHSSLIAVSTGWSTRSTGSVAMTTLVVAAAVPLLLLLLPLSAAAAALAGTTTVNSADKSLPKLGTPFDKLACSHSRTYACRTFERELISLLRKIRLRRRKAAAY